MNNNPEGTPNPLNPGSTPSMTPLDANPSEPVQPINPVQPVRPAEPVRPVESVRPAEPIRPIARPAEPTKPVDQVQLDKSIQPTEPTQMNLATEPTHSDPSFDSSVKPEKKPKKRSLGLIIAILVCLLVAVGCGVAAILLTLNAKNSDPVTSAIDKLMHGAPKMVSMDGDINITSTDSSMPYSSLLLKFQANIDDTTNKNYVSATITAALTDGNDFTFSVNEMKASDGNLYLKLSGIGKALNDYGSLIGAGTNCIDGVIGTNCGTQEQTLVCNDGEDCSKVEAIVPTPFSSVLDFIGVFEVIDDEWIKIPDSSFSSLKNIIPIDNPEQCLISAAGNLGKYGSDFARIYGDSPFVTYSTEVSKVTQKKDSLYKISFNNEKLASFINSMGNSGFMNEMLACMGGNAINREVTASDLSEITAVLPEIYTEIDENSNFTRVYLDFSDPSGVNNITADFSFTYPAKITIEEPEEYIDINEVLSPLLTMFYNGGIYDSVPNDLSNGLSDDLLNNFSENFFEGF